jgi:hypothetical protein
VCFLVFKTDEDAAVAFLRNLTGPLGRLAARNAGILAAMDGGSPEDVAAAMRTPPELGYYVGFAKTEEGKRQAYATAIRNAIRAAGNDVPSDASSATNLATLSSTSSGLVPVLLLAGTVTLGYLWWTGKPPFHGRPALARGILRGRRT